MSRLTLGFWLIYSAAIAVVPAPCLGGITWNVPDVELESTDTERIIPLDVYFDVTHGPYSGIFAGAIFDISPQVPEVTFAGATLYSTGQNLPAFPSEEYFLATVDTPHRMAVSNFSDGALEHVPVLDNSTFARLHVRVAAGASGRFDITIDQSPDLVGIARIENDQVKFLPNDGFNNGVLTIRPRPIPVSVVPSIYWSDWSDGGIERSNLSGNVVEEDWSTARANHVVVDTRNRMLYWSDIDGQSPAMIWRSHLDGTNRQLVLEKPLGAGAGPIGELALDVDARQIYYADSNTRSIRRVRFDGADDEFFAEASQLGPGGFAIDLRNDYLYWTDGTSFDSRLMRAKLDGSDISELAFGGGSFLDVRLDELRNHIYWVHQDFNSTSVLRADLDGENQITVLGPIAEDIGGIDIDPLRGKLYWSVQNGFQSEVRRSNLDGSETESVVTGQGTLDDLSVYYLPEYGDTNLDDVVDAADSATLAQHFGVTSGATWFDGDFNGDGAVDMIDVGLMQARTAPVLNMQGASSAVPEPSAALLLLAAGGFCVIRRVGKVIRRVGKR